MTTMREFTCKEGLLLKEELKLGKWKKRWMVLRVNEKGDPSLYYYKVDDYINECMPLGFVIPSCCTLFEYPAKNFAFELVAPPSFNSLSPRPATHFRFQATNTEEYKSWMSVLGLYTMAIEDLQHMAQSGGSEMVRSHSGETESFTDLPTQPAIQRSPSQLRTKQWEDNEAVLIKLFPDVDVQTIIDALEFCHGNRNDAIDLLAEQNKLNRPEINKPVISQSPSASFDARSDPTSSQKSISQCLSRLPFSWHRTQTPTLIPDPTQSSLTPSGELQKELLMLESQYSQISLPQKTPSPPSDSVLQRPVALRPSPNHLTPTITPPCSSPPYSPQYSPQPSPPQSFVQPPLIPELPVQPQQPVMEPTLSARKMLNLQQLVIPQSPEIRRSASAGSSPRTPSPVTPSLPAPEPFSHYTHYEQTLTSHASYQPLISPNEPQSSPQLLPPLALQSSPMVTATTPSSVQTTSSYTATSPTSPTTPITPTSPMSPVSPATSPRLHQFANCRYSFYRNSSAPSHPTLQHFEAYSPDSVADSPPFPQCHSHPHYTNGFTCLTGYSTSPKNSFSSLETAESSSVPTSPPVKRSQPKPLSFRIVGAARNTYYMDYIVEVITPELRWLIYRRYSNFSLLNAKLLKLGLAHPTKNVMPPKQFTLPPLASPFASDDLVQKRIDGLAHYLNSLVADHSHFFLNHPIGQTFLDPHVSSSEHNKVVNSLSK